MDEISESGKTRAKQLLEELRLNMEKIDTDSRGVKKEHFAISEKKGVMLQEIKVPALEMLSDKAPKKKG